MLIYVTLWDVYGLYWDSAIMGGTTVLPRLKPTGYPSVSLAARDQMACQDARVPQCFWAKLVDLPNSLPTVCGSEVVDGMVSIHLPHYSIRLSDLSHGNLFQFPWVGVKLNQQTSLGHPSRPALQVPNRQPWSETASKTPGESPGQMVRWVPGWVYSNVHITQFWECYHPVNILKIIHNMETSMKIQQKWRSEIRIWNHKLWLMNKPH
jgi:hypothetical protein